MHLHTAIHAICSIRNAKHIVFWRALCLCSCVNSSHAIVCIAFVFRYVHGNRIPIGVYNLVCNKLKSLNSFYCGIDTNLKGHVLMKSSRNRAWQLKCANLGNSDRLFILFRNYQISYLIGEFAFCASI